ncbi:MAG: 2-oxo acid dehydrogenase subunit E2 [Solobacterium sp.]|nr:2-oxo acid dehydrogenase subunit E2 [Solobacterium sp.]
MSEKRKRRWGDRRDGFKIKAPGLQTVMTALMPNRTDRECYLNETIDITDLLKYLDDVNATHPDYKITLFHCFVMALTKMFRERPYMNRFIQGGAIYERYEISCAFVAKRRFADHAEEALMFMVPKETDTLDDIAKKIIGDVRETRKSEHATGGVDELLDKFAAMPKLLMMFLVWIIRCMDFWGVNPKFITDGDPNYASIFLSNLGSIKCPAVYHHLNNYGTNSCMITIGTIHKEELIMPDNTKAIRDVVQIGATIDESIADGFYFARSLKLVKHLFAHPELLGLPLETPSNFEY